MRANRRTALARALTPLWLGLILTVGAGVSAAVADDVPHGDDEVSISVTIDEFDPCAVDAPGCAGGGDGGLAMTGLAIGIPLGAGIVLVGVGVGVYAVVSRRRKHLADARS